MTSVMQLDLAEVQELPDDEVCMLFICMYAVHMIFSLADRRHASLVMGSAEGRHRAKPQEEIPEF